MKKIVLTAVLLLSMSALIFAQQPRGGNRSTPEEMAKRTTEWMTAELKLTPEQVVKVDSINLVFAKKQAEQFQNGPGGDREARMAAAQKLNSEKEVALKPVLSKEQMEAYKKALEERRNPPGGGGRGN